MLLRAVIEPGEFEVEVVAGSSGEQLVGGQLEALELG
jgi:hypothetical protein